MSKILLDGEGLYWASNFIRETTKRGLYCMDIGQYDAIMNIINAIVLWDDIYILSESRNSNFIHEIRCFDQFKESFHVVNKCYYPKSHMQEFKNVKLKESDKANIEGYAKTLFLHLSGYSVDYEVDRALKYLCIANEMGLDYMPSIERQIILQCLDYSNFFIRKDALDKLDKELNKYYDSVNGHMPEKRISFPLPVFLDYLFNKFGKEGIVKGAFEIRQQTSVVDFREEMNMLDNAWKNGDIKSINEYFIEIENIVGSLTKSVDYERKINITIGYPPSLSFNARIPRKKQFHPVFLKDLAYYGINNRKPNLIEKLSGCNALVDQ